MDNINDLIGDAAKQLMAQADGIQNQKLKARAQRVARKCAAQGLWCSLHGLAVADGSCEWVEISAC